MNHQRPSGSTQTPGENSDQTYGQSGCNAEGSLLRELASGWLSIISPRRGTLNGSIREAQTLSDCAQDMLSISSSTQDLLMRTCLEKEARRLTEALEPFDGRDAMPREELNRLAIQARKTSIEVSLMIDLCEEHIMRHELKHLSARIESAARSIEERREH